MFIRLDKTPECEVCADRQTEMVWLQRSALRGNTEGFCYSIAVRIAGGGLHGAVVSD